MIRLELLDNCEESVWDDFVATFEGGTIFHTLAWMGVVEKLYQAEKLPVGIFDGAEMIGVFPLFRVRRGPLAFLTSPPGGVGYGGPLVGKSHYRAVMEQLDSLLKRCGASYIEFRSLENLTPTTLTARHYTVQQLQTHVLSLAQEPQKLWRGLKSECRTAVRKAWKENVKIVEATDKGFLDVYYEMAKDTFSKSNRPPPLSKQAYNIVWDMLRPYERIKVLLAKHDDKVLAGGIFLHFNQRVYYWDGASFRAYYRLNPNNLLHWTLIEWGASNGLREYDMLGANVPSIARFKRSFGGEAQTYTYAYKDVTLPAYFGRRVYHWLVPRIRRIRFRLRPA
jgi:CelD/BcsL family acetyltransferase involved in cellulose biosynthesis